MNMNGEHSFRSGVRKCVQLFDGNTSEAFGNKTITAYANTVICYLPKKQLFKQRNADNVMRYCGTLKSLE